jgi:hypothetical protein
LDLEARIEGTKIVLDNKLLEQVRNLNYSGCRRGFERLSDVNIACVYD